MTKGIHFDGRPLLFKEQNIMNIKPGSYRVPLVAGLVATGEDELSKKVADQRIKLTVAGSIQGTVTVRTDLKQVFVDALNTEFAKNAADDGVVKHYSSQLILGSVVPVESITQEGYDRYYAPGELFFGS